MARIIDQIAIHTHAKRLSDKAFAYLDHIIGGNQEPTKGTVSGYVLWNMLDKKKLLNHMSALWREYEQQFKSVSPDIMKIVPLRISHNKPPIFFPVLMNPTKRNEVLLYLQSHDVYAEQLLEYDSNLIPDRSKKLFDSVVIFPLTYTTTQSQIRKAAYLLKAFKRKNV